VGGRGEPRNSKNLPRWAAEFGKWRRGIWQNLPRKTVVPTYHMKTQLMQLPNNGVDKRSEQVITDQAFKLHEM